VSPDSHLHHKHCAERRFGSLNCAWLRSTDLRNVLPDDIQGRKTDKNLTKNDQEYKFSVIINFRKYGIFG